MWAPTGSGGARVGRQQRGNALSKRPVGVVRYINEVRARQGSVTPGEPYANVTLWGTVCVCGENAVGNGRYN